MSSSARRALTILETVAAAEQPPGVTEIARRLDLSPATVFRGLDALERAAYVGRYQASSRYVLGAGVARLRQSLFARFHVREVCQPYLQQLAFASGETVSLSVPVGWYSLRIAAAPGLNEVTSSPPLGEVRPLGQGSAGLALLAFYPAADIERVRRWTRRRRHSWRADLERELATVRKRGYAMETASFARDRAALAIPLRGQGRPVGAIAIEGPVLDLKHAGYHDDLRRWLGIVDDIGELVRARPALSVNPFAHLDPDTIEL